MLLGIEIVALILLLICSAFFSSAETALFATNPLQLHRLKRAKPKSAERIENLQKHPTRLLSTVLIGNTAVNISAAALAYSIAEMLAPGRGEIISIPIMTFLLLLFGEITPKRIAIRYSEPLAVLYAPLLQFLIAVLKPIRRLLESTASKFQKYMTVGRRGLTEDEFLTVVELGEEAGVLGSEERTMVDGIIGLEDTQVSEVMTPRVDLIGIDLNDPPEVRTNLPANIQFRYLPLYRKNMDHPEGFLDVNRYLLSSDRNFEAAVIAPFFVPETIHLEALLMTFQKEGRRVALVMDEYGGTAGLVTLGDILEEIIGDVEEQGQRVKLTIEKMSENRWIADGSISLDEINDELGVELSAEGADRISGWVSACLQRIPRTGDVAEAQGCRVMVHRTRRNRVVTVFIERVQSSPTVEEMESWEL